MNIKKIEHIKLKPVTLDPTQKISEYGHFYQAETHGDILCVFFYSFTKKYNDDSFILYTDKEKNDFVVRTLQEDGSYAVGKACLDKKVSLFYSMPLDDDSTTTIMEYFKDTEAFLKLQHGMITENESYKALRVIDIFQSNIRMGKLKSHHKKITDRIDAHMARVPELPSVFTEWIDEKVMDGYIYAHKEGKVNVCYCTKCKRDYTQKETIPRGKEGTCHLCGAKITYKNSKVTKALQERKSACILQKTDKGVIVRYFEATKVYRSHYKTPKMRLFEMTRHFFEGEHIGDYEYINFKQTGNIRWSDSIGRYNLFDTVIYSENIETEIQGTEFQYSSLAKYVAQTTKSFFLSHYLWLYKKYPVIEYIEKMQLYELMRDIVSGYSGRTELNLNGKTPLEVFGLGKNDLNQLKRINGGNDTIKWLKELAKTGITASDEDLMKLTQTSYYIKRFCDVLKYTKSVKKTLNYLNSNQTDYGKNKLSTWVDYLDACKDLKYNLSNTQVLYPKDLKTAHDDAISLFKAVENKIYDEKIKELSEKLASAYNFKDDGFVIVVPSSVSDIVYEGKVLDHCVGKMGYIKRMAEGDSYIVFVRAVEDPSKPLCTLEVKNNSILQKRVYDNQDPGEDILKFLQKWDKKVLSKCKVA